MKKKLISMLLVCAMAAGALAGCGGSSGGSSGGGAGAGTEKAAPVPLSGSLENQGLFKP